MQVRNLIVLGVFLVLCLTVAGIGGAVTATSVDDWYRTLAKPSFNPPDWVFGPVWTVLYVMMAVAAWRVWRTASGPARTKALMAFAVQLALNLLWTILFFGLHRIGLAFVEILALDLAVAVTLVLFRRIDRPAGWLLMPYLAWIAFASVLNAAIWSLN